MKVVLAGAYGKLGSEILKALVANGHDVVAADMVVKDLPETEGKVKNVKVDVTDPKTLAGICDGAEVVITTVGLTGSSTKVTNYDIDLNGNKNLLEEAKKAGVKKFNYISVIKADGDPKVPMLHAKALFEEELKKSGISWIIYRPTGYFYDIVKVFKPMVEKGEVTLLGKKPYHANVVDTPDFAAFIVDHMCDDKQIYEVGGKESWTYEEIAKMCFDAAGKPAVIKRAPKFLFSLLANAAKKKKNGKEAIIRFSKWTLTNEMVGSTKVGDASFKEYIYKSFKEEPVK
ncbi:MAG: SDR family oxidoreductase [Sphaerochaetaceae bacterium]|nr:SDR family oxidoreductase [Sphaerochaetaceae bacterium]